MACGVAVTFCGTSTGAVVSAPPRRVVDMRTSMFAFVSVYVRVCFCMYYMYG